MSKSAPARMKGGRMPLNTTLKANKDLPALKLSGRCGYELPPGTTDVRDICVLSPNEWNRIMLQLNKRQTDGELVRRAEAERLALHELSQQQVKTWTNTVLGSREKKLAGRKAREEKEESERVLMDIEEAKLRAQQRKEIMEQAKCQQYYQTDRVKGFHSALLLTEVLKERDAQVDINNAKRNAHLQSDIEWREKIRQDYLDSLDSNNAEKQLQREKKMNVVNYQLEQVQNKQKMREAEKENALKEAEELEKDLAKLREEEKQRALQRDLDAQRKREDIMHQVDDTKYLRHIEKLKDEEEDEQCRLFAAAKRKMIKMRMAKEEELANEKLEKLERIREKLMSQMLEKLDDEDARIRRAQEETDARILKETQEKEEKRRRDLQAIHEHCLEDIQHRKKMADDQKAADMALLAAREETNQIAAAKENEKQRRRHEEALKFSKLHLEDAEARQENRKREREFELEMYKRDRELAELEEKQFQRYARSVIDHEAKHGRNVIPLERAAREGHGGGLGPVYPGRGPLRPSYVSINGNQLGSKQRSSTDEVRRMAEGEAGTTKRLGFVW